MRYSISAQDLFNLLLLAPTNGTANIVKTCLFSVLIDHENGDYLIKNSFVLDFVELVLRYNNDKVIDDFKGIFDFFIDWLADLVYEFPVDLSDDDKYEPFGLSHSLWKSVYDVYRTPASYKMLNALFVWEKSRDEFLFEKSEVSRE